MYHQANIKYLIISQSSSPVLADSAAVSPAGAGGEALAKVFLLAATCALSCRYNIDPLLVEYDTCAQVTLWLVHYQPMVCPNAVLHACDKSVALLAVSCSVLVFEVIYQTLVRVFDHISKHRGRKLENEAQPSV